MPVLTAHGCTHRGQVRPSNQDAFVVDAAAGLFIVSDGMGGANCGEVASARVVSSLHQELLPLQRAATGTVPQAELPRPCGSATYTCLGGADIAPVLAALQHASALVHADSLQHPRCAGMGATAAVLLLHRGHWLAANVGDSPIYLFRDDRVHPMHTTHTLEAEFRQTGMTTDAGELARARHILTRAMGMEGELAADYCQMPARPGDLACLCSDGLSNKVSPEEILALCLCFSPQEACENLIALANARGGEDNVTVVVCRLAQEGGAGGFRARLGRLVRGFVGPFVGPFGREG